MERDDLYALRNGMKGVAQLRDQIAELELKRISPRSAAYGSERVQTSSRGDLQPDQIAKIDELIERYKAELDSTLALQEEFERLIQPLNPFEKRIMRYYYIDGMIWEQVWQETNYCTRHLMRIHRKVLDALFPEEVESPK